ncbi:alpha/beta hydrolase [Sphingomonas sp. GB1N7]|uniref:alpha/beta hydrolase n=1 Tax=Parasphingomonas caseinilytica TaxID=3096158 RepID=UPI002FCA0F8F
MLQETGARPPSKLLWALEVPRAFASLPPLIAARRRLMAMPRGDGRPVLILPGLVNSDRSTFVLRRYLNALGYRAEGWGLGRNLGSRAIGVEGDLLFDRIRRLHAETDQPVTLVGISLGGIMARLAAHRVTGSVREVITISSPYAGHPHATNVWRVFELVSGEKVDADRVTVQRAEIMAPLPVPATAIWSRSDGLVNGTICRVEDEPGCRVIEVRSSHLWVQMRAEVLAAVAGVLGGM